MPQYNLDVCSIALDFSSEVRREVLQYRNFLSKRPKYNKPISSLRYLKQGLLSFQLVKTSLVATEKT